MAGSPPFHAESLVTLANWQQPPYNRWSFQHVRELTPTARIPRGDAAVWELPTAELDLERIKFTADGCRLTVGQLLERTYPDGFLVIHKGMIVVERYFNGMAPDTAHLLMAVSNC